MAEAPEKPAAVTVVRWSGELLWPQPLPEAAVIDLARVTALGTWAYAWFAARPQQAATGATPALKRQLQRAGVSLLWCDHPHGQSGVSAAERALLWGDDRAPGAPLPGLG